jgi:hypothetical protein
LTSSFPGFEKEPIAKEFGGNDMNGIFGAEIKTKTSEVLKLKF